MEIDPVVEFTWPTQPPEAWWQSQGAALKLDDGQIKFAASLYLLGGADSKKNSRAATLAGLNADRTQAFRLTRSVAIRRLLTMAEEIKAAKRPPVTEAEVDQQIDRLIRSPDALTVARGIELRQKRKDAKQDAQSADDDDPFLADARFVRMFLRRKHGAGSFMLFWRGARGQFGHPELYPLLLDVHHLAMREEFGPQIWKWAVSELSDTMRQALDEHLADPEWQLAMRLKVWGEVNETPPAPVPGSPLKVANAQ